MEISLLNSDGTTRKVGRPMEKYLARLKSLPYTKVVIKFYDIAYVREFTKGPMENIIPQQQLFRNLQVFREMILFIKILQKKKLRLLLTLLKIPSLMKNGGNYS